MTLRKDSSNMDKELLLAMDDSDDAVEEFKLPQTRKRRSKPRKGQNNNGELKIASSAPGSSILSWRCAFVFVLLTVFLSGGMLIAFYMLNMQSQIVDLQSKIEKITNQEKLSSSLTDQNTKRLMDVHNSQLKILDGNVEKMQKQVEDIEKKIKSLEGSSTAQLSHRFKLIEQDVDSLKTGMAKTGGDLDKLRDDIDKNSDSIKSVKSKADTSTSKTPTKLTFNNTVLQTQLDTFRDSLTATFNQQAKEMKATDNLELSNLKSITDSIRIEYLKAVSELNKRISKIEHHANTSTNGTTNGVDNISQQHAAPPNIGIIVKILHDIDSLKNESTNEKLDMNSKVMEIVQVIEELKKNVSLSAHETHNNKASENKSISSDSTGESGPAFISLRRVITELQNDVELIKKNMSHISVNQTEEVGTDKISNESIKLQLDVKHLLAESSSHKKLVNQILSKQNVHHDKIAKLEREMVDTKHLASEIVPYLNRMRSEHSSTTTTPIKHTHSVERKNTNTKTPVTHSTSTSVKTTASSTQTTTPSTTATASTTKTTTPFKSTSAPYQDPNKPVWLSQYMKDTHTQTKTGTNGNVLHPQESKKSAEQSVRKPAQNNNGFWKVGQLG